MKREETIFLTIEEVAKKATVSTRHVANEIKRRPLYLFEIIKYYQNISIAIIGIIYAHKCNKMRVKEGLCCTIFCNRQHLKGSEIFSPVSILFKKSISFKLINYGSGGKFNGKDSHCEA